ncbi:hypothetical protein OIU77_030567 [Salix suchowensis]|uniref:Disease resistance protein RPS2 n=1 Tax=Salix suchowensis TaxID=1278906 RepID=A0ABQ9BCY4_9ROSI|nr:hypothetical protein OIU77_030567 [Salix suchowensis]
MDFVVSPLIGVAHSLCISVAARLSYVLNVDKRIDSLSTALNELKDRRDDLKRQVGRAEVEGLTCTSQVKGWLQRVEDIEAESSSVIEDLGRGGRCCVGRNACCSSYKLSKKASKLLSRATELIGKGAFDVVADNPVPDAVEEVPSRPAVGLNMMLERVRQFLADDEVGTVGIYGMGGVGKTTLLKIINNEFLTRSHHFDVVIWVVVSKEFVVDKIQRAVGARLGSSHTSYVYDQGHALIGSLKVACLLETGDERTQVKMHDVVRSFALWIASECELSNRFLVEASTGLTEAPRADNWKHALRISLFDNGITTLAEIPQCPRLSTLLLQWNSGLNKISNAFFQFMPALRVLDLSFTSLREIPASISELVELRHLDLSGTKITSLPKELGGLTKLQHLDLQRTHSLRIIPQEAISGLLQLRILNVYYSYGVWEQQDNEVGFADLQCLKHLTTLGITIDELNTLKRLYSFSGLLKVIQYLYIIQCDDLYYLQLSLNSSFGERLRRLSINNCYDLQYLQVDEEAGQKWLPSLEVVALHNLPNLETVWKNPVTRESLQNLRSVNIWHCRRLRNVSWVIQLPKLEVIYLMYCKEMEEVVSRSGIAGEDSKAFQSLRTLSIRDLPKLRSITPWELAFPSLESIAVIDCPKLKQLSIKTHNTPALPTVYGNKEWWDGLEWNEASSETALYPHFMPI